jgi:hypothetical protein
MQKLKHNPEVRKYLQEKQRKYRAKKKAKEAQADQTEASLACQPPVREVSNNGDKKTNK